MRKRTRVSCWRPLRIRTIAMCWNKVSTASRSRLHNISVSIICQHKLESKTRPFVFKTARVNSYAFRPFRVKHGKDNIQLLGSCEMNISLLSQNRSVLEDCLIFHWTSRDEKKIPKPNVIKSLPVYLCKCWSSGVVGVVYSPFVPAQHYRCWNPFLV